MFNNIHEECGIFAIYSKHKTNVNMQTYIGLYALQTEGQESCGIVVNDKGLFNYHKDIGLVHNEVFDKDTLAKLGEGNIAIGHVRYSTTGNSNRSNAQPLVVRHIKDLCQLLITAILQMPESREEYEQGEYSTVRLILKLFHMLSLNSGLYALQLRKRLKKQCIGLLVRIL